MVQEVMLHRDPAKGRYVLLFLYVVLISVVSAFHEPWRDEYQALLLGNSAANPLDVVYRARYEGHPSLWYLILHAIPTSWNQELTAKAIAVGIMATVAWVIVFRAPFTAMEKIGVLSGYFFVYEYAAFFRNYGIAVLLVLLTVLLVHGSRSGRTWAKFLPLLILPFTQIYGLLLSLALCATLWIARMNGLQPFRWSGQWKLLVAFAIMVSLAILDIIPASDGYFYGSWSLEWDKFLHALRIPIRAFVPIPSTDPSGWDRTIIEEMVEHLPAYMHDPLFGLLSMAILTVALWSLRRDRAAGVFFLISTTLILAFSAIRFQGSLRHHGMLFMAYLAAVWISRRSLAHGNRATRPHANNRSASTLLFAGLLALQAIGGVIACSTELRYPFSGAKEVARFIRTAGLEDHAVFSACEDIGISVAGALNKEIYYPIIGRKATYMPWNSERRWGIPREEHLRLFAQLEDADPHWLYLTNGLLPQPLLEEYQLIPIHVSGITIRKDEGFVLYQRRP